MRRRIVIITEIIAPYRIPVFNALARQEDIDLHVIFLSKTDVSLRQWRVYEDEIRFSYEILPSWRRRIGKYNFLINQGLTSALQAAHPRVLICGGYNYVASWQAMRWAKRNAVQFLLWSESTARDSRKGHSMMESLKKFFVSNCDAFIVPGKSALDYLAQMGVSTRRIFVARNAVDMEVFARLGQNARMPASHERAQLGMPERYFLFVGRLVREKGVRDLLEAYGTMAGELRERIGLVFAGDGPMRAELEAMGREIYPGSVQFAGFVDRDRLASYYGLSECLVLPTYSDTWGLVVNEAMSCGLPVICTNVAGCAAELIQNNGRLVEPGNVQQLSQAMAEIASDSAQRDEMGAQSYELIRGFSPEAWAAGIAEAAHAVDPS